MLKHRLFELYFMKTYLKDKIHMTNCSYMEKVSDFEQNKFDGYTKSWKILCETIDDYYEK